MIVVFAGIRAWLLAQLLACAGIRCWMAGMRAWSVAGTLPLVGPVVGSVGRLVGSVGDHAIRVRTRVRRVVAAGLLLAFALLVDFPGVALAQSNGSSFDPTALVNKVVGVAVAAIVLVVIGKALGHLSKGAVAALVGVIVIGSVLYVVGSNPQSQMSSIGHWFTDAAGMGK